MYYQLRTTRMNCDCQLVTHTDDSDEYVRDPDCEGYLREWIPGQKGTKEGMQLMWEAVLNDGDEAVDAQVRLQNMALLEFCEKVINPKHYFSIGQDKRPRVTTIAAPTRSAQLDSSSVQLDIRPNAHGWSDSRLITNAPLKTKLQPPGWKMREVSSWASKALREADKMEEAVERDFWLDLPRGALHIDPYMVFGPAGDLSLLELPLYNPFSRTVAVARNVADTLPGDDPL